MLGGEEKERVSQALLKAHDEARDQHSSEYQYYAPQLPEPYLSRREQFGRLFYGALGIKQSDMVGRARQTAKNYGFFGAPVGLIIAIDRRLQVGSWLDLGMFVQNVMIAAGARGLQTCPAGDVLEIPRSAERPAADTSRRNGGLWHVGRICRGESQQAQAA